MRISVLTVLLTALLVSPLLAVNVEGFESTYADAVAKAKKQNKPLYLHFTTDWCGWCRRIEQDTYTDTKAKKALEHFVPASLDCTVPRGQEPSKQAKINRDLMQKYGGSGYPFLAMVTPDGIVLGTISGYVKPDQFVEELAKAREVHKRWKQFQKDAKTAKKDDYDFQAKAMKIYAEVNKMDKAAEAAKRVCELDPENKKGDAAEAAYVLLQDAWKSLSAAEDPKTKAKAGKRIDSQVEKIRKLDPKNEKRILQKALQGEAMRHIGQVRRSADRAEAFTHLRAASTLLQELTGSAKTIENKQQVYAMLGQTHLFLQERDQALQALKTALEADEDSPIAGKLKQRIQQLEAAG